MHLRWFSALFLCLAGISAAPLRADDPIELVVRADDAGAALAVNEACLLTATHGIATSVEVIVPGPWFADAASRLASATNVDVGVHLTLTSEWEGVKWGPLTKGKTLADTNGWFRPMTSQRADFPPDTGFLTANPDPGEVEAELRSQIEKCVRHLPRTSHVTLHMGAAGATPQLRAITERLCREYRLRMEGVGLKPARWAGGTTAEEKEASLVKMLEELGPGRWQLVEHPGFDTPEMRAIGHHGYRDVASDRDGVTRAYISPKVLEVVRRRGIRLIGYRDL